MTGDEMPDNLNLKDLESAASLNTSELNAVLWLDSNWEDILPTLVSILDDELESNYPNYPDSLKTKNELIRIYIHVDDSGNWDGCWLGAIETGSVVNGIHSGYLGAIFNKFDFKGIHSSKQIGISKEGFNLYFSGKINPNHAIGPVEPLDHKADSEVEKIAGDWELKDIFSSSILDIGETEGHLKLADVINKWSESSSVTMTVSSNYSVTFNVTGPNNLDIIPFDLSLQIYRLIGLGGYSIMLVERDSPVVNSAKDLLTKDYWITSSPSHDLTLYGYDGDNRFRARFIRKGRFFGAANPNPIVHKSVATFFVRD
jgi:hypothetical protein